MRKVIVVGFLTMAAIAISGIANPTAAQEVHIGRYQLRISTVGPESAVYSLSASVNGAPPSEEGGSLNPDEPRWHSEFWTESFSTHTVNIQTRVETQGGDTFTLGFDSEFSCNSESRSAKVTASFGVEETTSIRYFFSVRFNDLTEFGESFLDPAQGLRRHSFSRTLRELEDEVVIQATVATPDGELFSEYFVTSLKCSSQASPTPTPELTATATPTVTPSPTLAPSPTPTPEPAEATLFGLSVCTADGQPSADMRLWGRVLDAVGQPIEGIQVTLALPTGSFVAFSGSEGYYRFPFVKAKGHVGESVSVSIGVDKKSITIAPEHFVFCVSQTS